MSNVTPMFLAYLDVRITNTSLSATGENCRVDLRVQLTKSLVLLPFNFYVFTVIQRYPMNRFECESPPRTNSVKKNHLHIMNETPFQVDVLLCYPAERYITDEGAVPKQIPVKP